MSQQILKCCNNKIEYLISYKAGSQYHVCGNCIKNEIWTHGIKEKTTINNSSINFPQKSVNGITQ